LAKSTTEQDTCRVRSGTDRPCSRPAVVKIRGIPFCEPCAREQQAYFAIGELTEGSGPLSDEALVAALQVMWWEAPTGSTAVVGEVRGKVAIGQPG
jgi:hypothetical protein